MTPTPDPLREAWEALRQSIGTGAEDQGAEHWHHASGGRQMPTERDGVFVDRQTVHELIAHFRPAIDAALAQPAPARTSPA